MQTIALKMQVTKFVSVKKNKFIYYETKSRNLEKINVDWESSDSLEAEQTKTRVSSKQQSLF